jgi:hypothetical protein
MVRLLTSLAACLLLCLGLAGCVGDGSDQPVRSAASPVESTPKAPADKDVRAAEVSNRRQASALHRLRWVDRRVPENAEVIIAPFTGHGDRRLSINPRRKIFSVGFMCEGRGRFDIVTGSDTFRPQRCLPAGYWLTVATDGSPQVVRLHAAPGLTWRMAVIEGEAPNVDIKLMN